MRNLLGGKGANLAEMASIGLPVPPGFTLTTEVCTAFYQNQRKYPNDLGGQVHEALDQLEKAQGLKFGDKHKPLLVSVRSGARVSMPGMMDTVLNLGLNDVTVEGLGEEADDPRFAWDSYRRFIQMYGSVVLGVDHHRFEEIIEHAKLDTGVTEDTQLSAQDWHRVAQSYKDMIESETGKPFPQDPEEQLWGAIGAVFGSWMNHRAITYRKLHDIPAEWGTAVNVQAMVFGNMGNDCATGVCFTRDPSTGENVFYGEYLVNAQGEDVVAGIRTPQPVSKHGAKPDETPLEVAMPEPYAELLKVRERLEQHYHDMQDLEFTIQQNKLYMLQTRNGKRTAAAIAADRGGHGARRPDRPGRGGAAGQPGVARPVAAPDAGSEGAAHAAGQGPAGQSRRRVWRRRVHRRRGGKPRAEGRGDHPGARRDQPRGHPRHARRPRHPDHARRHDQPRRGGGARHGPALRRRCRRHLGRLRRPDAFGRRQDGAGRRDHHAGWRRGRGVRRHRRDDRAGDVRRLRHADGLGGQGAHAWACGPTPKRRWMPRRRRSSAPTASACAAPSTCSSTRSASARCGR